MKGSRAESLWFLGLTGPALLGFLLFALGPMLYSFYLSLTQYNVVSPPRFIGLQNYVYLLTQDPAFWPSVKVTALYAGASVPLNLTISLAVALLLNARARFIGALRTIYFLPSLLPAVASGVLWVWIFDPRFGLLNALLARVGIQGPAWTQSTTWALPALILMGLWGFGGAMIIFLAALQGVPSALYEAAEVDGANALRRFWHVTVPQISPVLFFNMVMGFIGAMKVFDSAYVFGATSGVGPGGPARATLFYVLNLYQKSFNYFHMGLGSAMAWILFLAILVLTFLNFKLGRRWVFTEGR